MQNIQEYQTTVATHEIKVDLTSGFQTSALRTFEACQARPSNQLDNNITELKLEVQKGFHDMDSKFEKGFHDIESKFQTILSQWLFRAAQLVSPITSTFLTLQLMRYY